MSPKDEFSEKFSDFRVFKPIHSSVAHSCMQSFGMKLPERSISAIVVFLYNPSPIAATAALPSAHLDKISFLKS